MKLTTLQEAIQYIIKHIPRQSVYSYPGQKGVDRVRYTLSLLGNPQEQLKIIHIAGTSGKGSTSYLISLLLHANGFSTGLYNKPHIKDIRERFQINHSLLSQEKFILYLNELVPVFEEVERSEYGRLTYFEMNSILAFYIFHKEGVDYAVIETGLGGLYDGTNVVKNKDKFFVLTSIGFDHTQILGTTYKEIATQKAGIIQSGNHGISIEQHPDAETVIESTLKEKNAFISWIRPDKNIFDVKITKDETIFNFMFNDFSLKKLSLGLLGFYQAENAGLALAAIYILSKRDKFILDELHIRQALKNAYLPGRLEIKEKKGKILVIDGAHNPQKMEAFLNSLQILFPGKKFHFLLSFKKGKDIDVMLRQILPFAKRITVSIFYTSSQEMVIESENLESIKSILEKIEFRNFNLEEDYKKAFSDALENTDDILVVTGSLYFIGELYPLIEN